MWDEGEAARAARGVKGKAKAKAGKSDGGRTE